MGNTVNGTLLNIQVDTNAVEVYSRVDKAAKTASLTAERLVRKLKEQEVALKKGKDQADLYAAAMDGASLDQLAAIASTQNRIRAEQVAADALRAAANEERIKAAETQRGRAAVDSIIQSLKEQNMVLTRGQDHLVRYRALQAGATKEELRALKALQLKNREMMVQEKGFEFNTRKGRQFNAMFGQMGHQLQDITVQMQMGTNAGIIFAQQGSQILSVFGHWGAIAGAVAAIGGALYTATSATAKARESMDELSSSLDTAASKYRNALGAARDLARIELGAKMDDLRASLGDVSGEMALVNQQITSAAMQGNEKEVEKLTDKYRILSVQYQAGKQRLDEFNKLLQISTKAQQDAIDRTNEQNRGIANLIVQTVEESQTFGMTADQILRYQLEKSGANEETIKAMVAIKQETMRLEEEEEQRKKNIEALKRQAEEQEKLRNKQVTEKFDEDSAALDKFDLLKESFKSEAELAAQATQEKINIINDIERRGLASATEIAAAREALALQTAEVQQKALDMANMSMMNSMGQFAANMASSLDETSGIGKAFFLVSKGIAAAQAIIEAEKGAAGAMAAAGIRAAAVAPVDPTGALAAGHLATGTLHANIIRGMGYASAGMIAGQALASFDGGGIVGGVRAGGVDGIGGKLAVVHPQEAIGLPEQLTGGGPVSVNFSINAVDAEGFDKLLATRQGMIVNMINRAVNNSGRRSIV